MIPLVAALGPKRDWIATQWEYLLNFDGAERPKGFDPDRNLAQSVRVNSNTVELVLDLNGAPKLLGHGQFQPEVTVVEHVEGRASRDMPDGDIAPFDTQQCAWSTPVRSASQPGTGRGTTASGQGGSTAAGTATATATSNNAPSGGLTPAEQQFVNDLASIGVTSTGGPRSVVGLGYSFCSELSSGKTKEYMQNRAYAAITSSPEQAHAALDFAIKDLCPNAPLYRPAATRPVPSGL